MIANAVYGTIASKEKRIKTRLNANIARDLAIGSNSLLLFIFYIYAVDSLVFLYIIDSCGSL
jgi:hypothetical protein